MTQRFDYDGPPDLLRPVEAALEGVVDPEMSLDIVNLGLVYGVKVTPDRIDVALTMTSAACPMTELIVEDVHDTLAREVADGRAIDVAVVWDPPWSPARMSARARDAMGW